MVMHNSKINQIIIFVVFLFSFLKMEIPLKYELFFEDEYRYISANRELLETWPSPSVVDLRLGDYEELIAGTSGGIGKIHTLNGGLIEEYFMYSDSSLPRGGIPSLVTYDLDSDVFIAASGVELINYASGEEKSGSGISWSFNNGGFWNYIQQPTDAYPECELIAECDNPLDCECSPSVTGCSWNYNLQSCSYQGAYIPFEWYGQTLFHEPIPITVNNISYDLSLDSSQNYLYAASWAGSLRRFNIMDENPSWELVPLPMNNQDSLICGDVPNNYYYNPIDGQGFHNHKGFSVHVENDIIWAGTANGINKGLIREDGCIDWYHYTFEEDENIEGDVDGNWIIGIIPQYYQGDMIRMWFVSWTLSGPAPHNLFYTEDNGSTWVKVDYFLEEGAIVYDLMFNETIIFASTDIGLYKGDILDAQSWIKEQIPDEILDQVGTEKAYTSIVDNNGLWIGTPSGVLSYDLENNQWNAPEIFDNNLVNNMLIYPNPYMIDEDEYNNHITYKIKTTDTNGGVLEIYDFSMTLVKEIECHPLDYDLYHDYQYCWWDGTMVNHTPVDNGVYFSKFKNKHKTEWDKVVIIHTQ